MPMAGRSAVRRHGLDQVSHGDDARELADVVVFAAAGIAAAVQPLVVLEHGVGDRRRQAGRLQELPAGLAVPPDDRDSASLRLAGLLGISAGTVILPGSWTVAARRSSRRSSLSRCSLLLQLRQTQDAQQFQLALEQEVEDGTTTLVALAAPLCGMTSPVSAARGCLKQVRAGMRQRRERHGRATSGVTRQRPGEAARRRAARLGPPGVRRDARSRQVARDTAASAGPVPPALTAVSPYGEAAPAGSAPQPLGVSRRPAACTPAPCPSCARTPRD